MREARDAERGSTIVIALVILTPILIVGGAMLSSLSSYSRQIEAHANRTVAKLTSLSGAHDALGKLSADQNYTGSYDYTINSGLAVVSVDDFGVDGDDNNDDGQIDELEEQDLLYVRSEGWIDGASSGSGTLNVSTWFRSVLQSNVRRVDQTIVLHQALYLADPFASIALQGPFAIDGQNSDSGGGLRLGGSGGVAGFGAPGPTATILAQIDPFELLNIRGAEGGTASVIESPYLPLETLFGPLRSAAEVELVTGEPLPPETQVPMVYASTSDIDLTGFEGAGILVVDGNLVLSGAVVFDGLVVVRGRFESVGTNQLNGAVWILGENSTALPTLDIDSGFELVYSGDAIIGADALYPDGLELLTWSQDSSNGNHNSSGSGEGGGYGLGE